MIIHSKRIYLEDGCFNGYLEVEGKKIKAIYPKILPNTIINIYLSNLISI